MKLFTKYNRINITASVIIFIAGTFAFYFALRYVLIRQLDETLRTEQAEIRQFVNEHNELPEIVNTNDQQITVTKTSTPVAEAIYSAEKTWDPKEKERKWVRKIQFTLAVNNDLYDVVVRKSLEATDYLLKLIIMIAIVMIALILVADYVINRVVLKKLWQPFYHTISVIRQYQLTKQQALRLPQTGIDEFSLLNLSVNNMAERVQQEYQVLKDFTGNAAHEMQTPLAVIATHTDTLMQDEQVLQHHTTSIATIEQSVKRLSRLNQSLLLLAKIENGRFELNEQVQWNVLLEQKINEWQELITAQDLKITLHTVPVTTLFHQHLADIVISNLLSNSIRYNIPGGTIAITLTNEQFSIVNTSSLPALDEAKLFNRFFRHPATEPEGNGLGLSIVKQVCDLAHYKISYQYRISYRYHTNEHYSEYLHVFTIVFK